MRSNTLLTLNDLKPNTDTAILDFTTTEDLENFTGFFGQHRALSAISFGIGMQRPGYNVFVMGNPHTGRFSFAMENLKQAAKEQADPADWCYLNNLQDSRLPIKLKLPKGQAKQLRDDVAELLNTINTELPAAFESPAYQRMKSQIDRQFNQKYDQAIDEVEDHAREQSIALYRDAGSVGFTPVVNGQAMDEAAYSQLGEEDRERFSQAIIELEAYLNEQLTELPMWRRENNRQLHELISDTADQALEPLIKPLLEAYESEQDIGLYLREIKREIMDKVTDLIQEDGKLSAHELEAERREYFKRTFGVNLLVDNATTCGAPVIYEAHPSYENLFGRIEYSTEMGSLTTSYQLIRPGAMHRANGGYLVLEAEKLLEQPFVYSALKRALKSGELKIENPGSDITGVSTITLSPEPIPLQVKLVLIGSRHIYYLLQELDHDFEKMFRVVVDFEEDVPRDARNIRHYARLIKTLGAEESLAAISREAVGKLVDQSSRLAEDQELLSAHIGELVDLLCESDYRRRQAGEELITASHVEAALNAKEERTGRLAQKILDDILNGKVLIATEDSAVGKANGLTILQVGDVAFGTPARITATVYPGDGGIVDIEREVELGQPIHSKGVMILTGYLGHKYSQGFPIALSANIAMEQSYGYIDGDSASLAEICTLISALTGIPIYQHFATTGSINQYGQVQAIGGVNEKIEGFFRLCEARGLNGKQGVVIPKANVRNLMLRPVVMAAIEAGQFHIHAVESVDQCLEVLMGKTAGQLKRDGSYPKNSLNQQVVERLAAMQQMLTGKK